MNLKISILYLILAHWICFMPAQFIQPHSRVLQAGDNRAWAAPDYDDSRWDTSGSTNSHSNFWLRFKITYDSKRFTFQHPGLHIISLGSYELYWDGVLIAKNGKVGKSREEEIPGTFLSQVLIPDSLLNDGTHVVAFRVSNHHMPPIDRQSWNTFYLEEYKATVRSDLIITAGIFILAGLYLMGAIYYLFLFLLKSRDKEGLIFSIMCFLFFALILMEYLKFLYNYTYDFHFFRLYIILGLTLLITSLTPLFFLFFFRVPFRNYLFIFLNLLLIGVSYYYIPDSDLANRALSFVMWVSSLGIAIYSTIKQRKDSWIILLALLLSGAVVWFYNLSFRFLLYSFDISLFISFSILVLSMMYVLARRAREQQKAYEASLLLSSHLQNELLKKNIQPHFIMNTLTSLMEWIEESPKESITFIEALAKEFEIMSKIAEKKLIPIEQEIALCQHHIEIMKFRKEVNYGFTCENISAEEMIPPAIFHTLIENGISHSQVDMPVNMVLRFEKHEDYKLYQLLTYGKNKKTTQVKEGTGFKYIKSRLEENYEQQWKLDSHATEYGWLTDLYLFT